MKYEKSFPYVIKLKEWVEMMGAIETAQHKDHEAEIKKINKG